MRPGVDERIGGGSGGGLNLKRSDGVNGGRILGEKNRKTSGLFV